MSFANQTGASEAREDDHEGPSAGRKAAPTPARHPRAPYQGALAAHLVGPLGRVCCRAAEYGAASNSVRGLHSLTQGCEREA